MGLKVGEVKLEKWNPQWKNDFETEKQNLLQIFGSIALGIHHIGSTSIEGLDAKPVIDIAVELSNLSDFEKVRQLFDKLHDYSIKEENDPGEILIRKGPTNNRTHFIHIMEHRSQRMNDSLNFRNALRNNPQLREQYSNLKHELANKFPHNRKAYTNSKANFIKQVLNNCNVHQQISTLRGFVVGEGSTGINNIPRGR